MNKESLIEELKNKIISALNLQGVCASDIDAAAPLFEDDGLGLDSVDALELVVLLEKEYCINIEDGSHAKEIFSTVDSMADFILSKKS